MKRECENCGNEFEAARSSARFCSDRCRKAFSRAKNAKPVAETTVPDAETPPKPPKPDGFAEVDRLARARWALEVCENAINANRPNLPGLLREHSRLVQLVADLESEAEAEAEEKHDDASSPAEESAFNAEDFVTG